MEPPSCRLSLKVTPGARHDKIVGETDGAIRIRLHAPPTDGRANAALLKLLAGKLGIPKNDVRLITGAAARKKIVGIHGLAIDEARRRLLGTA